MESLTSSSLPFVAKLILFCDKKIYVIKVIFYVKYAKANAFDAGRMQALLSTKRFEISCPFLGREIGAYF